MADKLMFIPKDDTQKYPSQNYIWIYCYGEIGNKLGWFKVT